MLMGRLLHHKHWWECLGTIPKVLRIFDQERLNGMDHLLDKKGAWNSTTLLYIPHTSIKFLLNRVYTIWHTYCIYYMAYLL